MRKTLQVIALLALILACHAFMQHADAEAAQQEQAQWIGKVDK